MANIFRMVADR